MDSSVTTVTVQKNKIQMVGVGGGCFPKYSRVPHTRSTRDKFIFYPTPTPTLYSWSMNHMFIAAYTQGSVPTTKLYDHTQLAGLCSLCPLGRVTSSGSMD